MFVMGVKLTKFLGTLSAFKGVTEMLPFFLSFYLAVGK